MKFKIFEVNSNGKIEFTKEELEKILEEVYEEGRDSVKFPYTGIRSIPNDFTYGDVRDVFTTNK